MDAPKKYYEDNGYYIYRNLIPADLIDEMMAMYKKAILPSNKYFFRQSTNNWEKNKVSKFGYAINSYLNPHDFTYPEFQRFSDEVKKILCHPNTNKALQEITGFSEINLMQSMLFDLNTATPAHQDSYYLDSIPNGHLLAGWFALEDIEEDAGRFYVIPKSNFKAFDYSEKEVISNDLYLKKIKKYVDESKDAIYSPDLKKGDVLFWNSKTVHGSFATVNEKHSRKSFTAHYMPNQFQFGNDKEDLQARAPIEYGTYQGMKFRRIKNQYSTKLRYSFWYYNTFSNRFPVLFKTLSGISKKIKG